MIRRAVMSSISLGACLVKDRNHTHVSHTAVVLRIYVRIIGHIAYAHLRYLAVGLGTAVFIKTNAPK